MTYYDFLIELKEKGIASGSGNYLIVNDNCSVKFITGMNICEVKSLDLEIDPLDDNGMLLYLDQDIELRYYADQFDINDFVYSSTK